MIPFGQLCCVGTSATLMSKNALSSIDPDGSLINFASSLFGEDFDHWEQSIVKEAYQKLPPLSDEIPLWPTPHINEDFFLKFDSEKEADVRELAAHFHIYYAQGAHGDHFFTSLYDELEPIQFSQSSKNNSKSHNRLMSW